MKVQETLLRPVGGQVGHACIHSRAAKRKKGRRLEKKRVAEGTKRETKGARRRRKKKNGKRSDAGSALRRVHGLSWKVGTEI